MFYATLLNGEPLSEQPSRIVVPWWSFTKPVLAAAALSLVRDGLIQLDDPVQEGHFTLRQLLKHQAGLADYSELPEYHAAVAQGQTPWSADEMMHRLDGYSLRYRPGAGWRYSNVGYMLVARLIERVTGLGIEQALIQRVLSPLGLTQARLAKTSEDLAEVYPQGLASYDPGWVYHGLLVGPLTEAAALLDRLLGGMLLPRSLLRDMQEAFVLGGPLPGRPWATAGYGLGLMIGESECGHRLAGHTGVGPGGVIAVFHYSSDNQAATCAAFRADGAEGMVEAAVLEHLLAAVGTGERR
ncbi:serine hydrolase domain-containing protein [Pseudomonas cremoricolorata]|uniref:Beta-lactamase n=1 Tax=Pseudomonas cremoricolorata TaxID=157783 RepID=A0A089WMS0_9PSED|nr:serine hydrolase domain-containing protein [Pseudomonas cremoricolorata]AIR87737.1 beta-lactamase [Pseudomonas cremoricolorata]